MANTIVNTGGKIGSSVFWNVQYDVSFAKGELFVKKRKNSEKKEKFLNIYERI